MTFIALENVAVIFWVSGNERIEVASAALERKFEVVFGGLKLAEAFNETRFIIEEGVAEES